MSRCDTDVLVIGGGPAGASTAIHLARAGWSVSLLERSTFPRQKVCGECLSPASLRLLQELGLADRVLDSAGPEIRRVGWMSGARSVSAGMPPCAAGPYRYGRPIGRDVLDDLLLRRAGALGVRIIQPARARRVRGEAGALVCEYRRCGKDREGSAQDETLSASLVIDAHGSWERGFDSGESAAEAPEGHHPPSSRDADLLAFKAIFRETGLEPGLLPLVSLPGGYGGMIVADRGRTVVACCIRRGVVRACRHRTGCDSAGNAAELLLRAGCGEVDAALDGARIEGSWLSIGALRPGFHAMRTPGVLAVGNAAAEAHPLVGEGICMALESAALLASFLRRKPARVDQAFWRGVRKAYEGAARAAFARRLRLASLYAYVAMQRPMGRPTAQLIRHWPPLLNWAARLAGKARSGPDSARLESAEAD